MRITGLKPQKRSNKRLSVFVDGEFAFSLDRTTVRQFGLKEGQPVDARLLTEVVLEDQWRHCRNYVLLLLSYRARSEKELRQRLTKKGYSPAVMERVLTELKQQGLVDDEKLARDYVVARVSIGHKGTHRVKQELLKMGFKPEAITAALQSAPDETEAAKMVLEHFLPRYRRLDPLTRKRRLAGLLARRGFSPETVAELLSQLPPE